MSTIPQLADFFVRSIPTSSPLGICFHSVALEMPLLKEKSLLRPNQARFRKRNGNKRADHRRKSMATISTFRKRSKAKVSFVQARWLLI